MIRVYLILGLVIAGLGLTVYVQHLRASNAALETKFQRELSENLALSMQIATDASVRAADYERASKAEAELTAFKEKADAEIARLKHPDRLCLDGDDTDRVRAIFRNPLR